MVPNPGHGGDEGAGRSPKAEEIGVRPGPAYLEKGDIFMTLGLPDKFVIGLDTMAVTTSKSLQGFRDIPPGAHFLWFQQPSGVSRCGYWFITESQGQMHIKEWNRYDETMGEPTGQTGASNGRDGMGSIYPTLQPYTLHGQGHQTPVPGDELPPDWAQSPGHLWRALTSAISIQSLSRITGKQDNQDYLIDSTDSAKGALPSTNNELNFLFAQDFRDLQVLDLGSAKARVADTSSRIHAFLTNTNTTTNTPTNPTPSQTLLAELQFTFLTGTHLGNPACLEQWWNLVLKLVLRAHALALSHPRLAAQLLRALHAQLFYTEHYFAPAAAAAAESESESESALQADDGADRHGPSGDRPVFEYKPLYWGKLRLALGEYKARLEGLLAGLGGGVTPEQEAVGGVFGELEAWLGRRGWELGGRGELERDGGGEGDGLVDSEDEEDEQPVVVELDGEGREVGLVSFRD
ncbi:AAR2 protein-domain-containing protein [Chaetomium fimeti]|uniref:AAR2 protein-domain-containing protein n=1 Tax=Chaetomium fimeti TaxID=1854472 RepID=A0AAE0HHB3_9PEZI|nr:AAR2 protein-domain-containing protein [Chaetomium fimeti]